MPRRVVFVSTELKISDKRLGRECCFLGSDLMTLALRPKIVLQPVCPAKDEIGLLVKKSCRP